MNYIDHFRQQFAACPLIAIIRGVQPEEAEDIGDALIEAGIRIIEVPLNSPDPLRSIGLLAQRLGDRAVIGAVTVLSVEDVGRVASHGGQIIVSPSTDAEVIEATVEAGLVSAPGYLRSDEHTSELQSLMRISYAVICSKNIKCTKKKNIILLK